MTLETLDQQLRVARAAGEAPALSDRVWNRLATTVHGEVVELGEEVANQLRLSIRGSAV